MNKIVPATLQQHCGHNNYNQLNDLERQLRAELNRARIANRIYRTESGGGDRNLARAAQVSEDGVIENVERLTTKLQRHSFTKANVLEQREVNSLCRRTIDNATPGVSDHVRDSYTGRRIWLKTRGIEPLLECVGRVLVWIADHIRAIAGNECGNIAQTRSVEIGSRRKAETGLQRYDTRDFPATKNVPYQIVAVAEERQIVNVIRGEDVSSIKRCTTTVEAVVERVLRCITSITDVVRQVLGPGVSHVKL